MIRRSKRRRPQRRRRWARWCMTKTMCAPTHRPYIMPHNAYAPPGQTFSIQIKAGQGWRLHNLLSNYYLIKISPTTIVYNHVNSNNHVLHVSRPFAILARVWQYLQFPPHRKSCQFWPAAWAEKDWSGVGRLGIHYHANYIKGQPSHRSYARYARFLYQSTSNNMKCISTLIRYIKGKPYIPTG